MTSREIAARATTVLNGLETDGVELKDFLSVLASALIAAAIHDGADKDEVLDNVGRAYDSMHAKMRPARTVGEA